LPKSDLFEFLNHAANADQFGTAHIDEKEGQENS